MFVNILQRSLFCFLLSLFAMSDGSFEKKYIWINNMKGGETKNFVIRTKLTCELLLHDVIGVKDYTFILYNSHPADFQDEK